MPISDVEKIVRQEPLENCYEIGKELGRGKFAIVKRCTEKTTGAQYAAKILKKRRRAKSVREDILMEIDIMRQGMDHNRIIKLYEVYESKNEFHIIIELALGGELFRVIAVDPLPEVKARDVVFQILEGVCHLHTLNIIHMDLKPENLLLYRKGSLEIKIVDFGLAVQLQEGQEVKSLVGTAEYVSPEILSFEPLSTYSDMWSIGALTYALLAGYSPFQGETHQETFLNVSTCDYDFEDEVFDVVSSDAKDFIEKLLVRTPRKRLTAEQCLQHPWIKAHTCTTTTNNLDGSMSSLDSALCMDSASSMEPSPVSSASSSFSPAPSATSRSRGSSSVTATTTTTVTTSSTSGDAAVPSSTGNVNTSMEFSRPEDMKKVNEKLGQVSKLATEQLVADTAAKPRPEGSPTSTASSTSTLRGEEVNEPVIVTATETAATTSQREAKISHTSEVTDGNTESFLKIKSATLGRPSSEERRSTSFDCTRKTATLGRGCSPSRPEDDKEERRTTSFDHTKRATLPRPDRNNDVTTLDPKTIESLQRFHRLKERSKARESESYVQPLLKAKTPESGTRRRSDGEHLTASQRRLTSKSFENTAPVCTTEEVDKSPHSSTSPENVTATLRDSSPATPPSSRKSPVSTIRKSHSPDLCQTVDSINHSQSPNQRSSETASITTQGRSQVKELNTTSAKTDNSEKATCLEHQPKEQVITSDEKSKAEEEQEKLEKARKERQKAREERRRARLEEEKKREEEHKRIREEAEKKMDEERKRMERDREKAMEVRRRERERKQAQRNGSSSSGSSESLVKNMGRNKWAWSVEARTASDVITQVNGVKPEETKKEEVTETDVVKPAERKSSTEGVKVKTSPKSERKTSSDFFQFGTDYSRRKNGNMQQRTSPDIKRSASPQQLVKSPVKITIDDSTQAENVSQRTSSPVVIISPSPPPEERNHESYSLRQHRDSSPAAEQKRLKSNRRKTPVISTDALDAILRGEVEDGDTNALYYATELNPYHRSNLESCPEEDEDQHSPPQTKSSSPLIKRSGQQGLAERRDCVLPSALKNPNQPVTPEKRRVTLLTANERTQSADFDQVLSPERSDGSFSQSPSPDNFSKSFDASRSDNTPKPAGVSRLTVSGSYSSLSRSTPDLSDILGNSGKKSKKDARKVERSNSRRMGMGRSRMDSYVTSTEHSSSYYQSPASPHLMKSGRHATVTSRILSGGKGFLSKWNETSKNSRQNNKVST